MQVSAQADKSDNPSPAVDLPLSTNTVTGTASAGTQDIPGPGITLVPPQPGFSQATCYATGQVSQTMPTTGQAALQPQPTTSSRSSFYRPTGQVTYPPGSAFCDLPDDPDDSEQHNYSELDEGELSDSGENSRLQRI